MVVIIISNSIISITLYPCFSHLKIHLGTKNNRMFIQVFPYMSLNCLTSFFTQEPTLWRLHLLDMLFTGLYNLDHVLKNKLFLRIKNTTKIDIFPLLITYLKISFLHVMKFSWRIKHYRNRSLHDTYQHIQKYKFLLRVGLTWW